MTCKSHFSCINCTAFVLLSGTSSATSSPTRKEQPLFSIRQVGMICERLLKEREEKIREEYDEILTTKLAGKNMDVLNIRNLNVNCISSVIKILFFINRTV